MAELVRAKMAELQRTIDLRNAGKQDEAIALVQSDEGLNSMATLRGLAERVLADEERLLLDRSETTRRNNHRLLAVSLAAQTAPAKAVDISGQWTSSFETQVGTQTYTYDSTEKTASQALIEGMARGVERVDAVRLGGSFRYSCSDNCRSRGR
jgi:hypothetical protein